MSAVAAVKKYPGLPKPPASLLSQANSEGKVVVYTVSSNPASNAQQATEFNAIYPNIKVEYVALSTTALDTRVETEAQAGAPQSDVFLNDYSSFNGIAYGQGWALSLAKTFPNFIKDYPPQYTYNHGATAIYSILENGFAYNTNLVPASNAPTTYEDFAKPFWKDKLISQDPNLTQSGLFLWVALEQKYGQKITKEIAANVNPTQYYGTLTPATAALAAGEGAASLSALLIIDNSFTAQGAPLKFVQPSFATGVTIAAGLTKGGPDPAAGQIFLYWLFSKQGQIQLANGSGPGTGGSTPLDPLSHTKEFVTPNYGKDTPAGVAAIDQLIGKFN